MTLVFEVAEFSNDTNYNFGSSRLMMGTKPSEVIARFLDSHSMIDNWNSPVIKIQKIDRRFLYWKSFIGGVSRTSELKRIFNI